MESSSFLLSLTSRPTLYGTYRATSLGCNDWEKLIGAEDSLQLNCSKEGFNAVSTASDNSKTIVAHVTPELGLVLDDILITPLRVETQQLIPQIMVTDTSKLWDIFWCSKLFQSMYDLRKLTIKGGGEEGY